MHVLVRLVEDGTRGESRMYFVDRFLTGSLKRTNLKFSLGIYALNSIPQALSLILCYVSTFRHATRVAYPTNCVRVRLFFPLCFSPM